MGHESWVLWVVEFLTQEYNIIECDSSMEKGIERWPCNPRIIGSIPSYGNMFFSINPLLPDPLTTC
jgi:hypothetical protein